MINRCKIYLVLFTLLISGFEAFSMTGGQQGFFRAWYETKSKPINTYLTEDLAQNNDLTTVNVVESNFDSYPPFASSSADIRTFDGSESYLYAAIPSQIITNQPWTGEAWVNHDTFVPRSPGDLQPRTTIFSIYGPSAFNYQWIGHYTGSLRVGLRTTPTPNLVIDTGFTMSTGVWYHVAWAESQAYRKVYVNGSLILSNNTAFSFSAVPTTFYIGTAQPGLYELRGKMSEVRLWNYERSDQEILDNYNKRINGNEPGLVGYWPLNEGPL